MKRVLVIFLFALVKPGLAQSTYTLTEDKVKVLGTLKARSVCPSYWLLASYYQPSKEREYLIYGCQFRTYIADITDPSSPQVIDSVDVPFNTATVSGDSCYLRYAFSSWVWDLSTLPTKAGLLTIWMNKPLTNPVISGNRLYNFYKQISIYDISDRLNPVLIDSSRADFPTLPWPQRPVVKNDTIYFSDASSGFYRMYYDQSSSKFVLADSISVATPNISIYSSCVSASGNVFLFYDPGTLSTPVFKYENGNYTKLREFSFSKTSLNQNCSHLGNDWLAVYTTSEGISIFDVSNANAIRKTGLFSSFKPNVPLQQQGGVTSALFGLRNNKIIAYDYIKGIFILDASEAMQRATPEPTLYYDLETFPNPCSDQLQLKLKRDYASTASLYDLSGKIIWKKEYSSNINDKINTSLLKENEYILRIEGNEGQLTKKIIVKRN
jgi:hypothetical protein